MKHALAIRVENFPTPTHGLKRTLYHVETLGTTARTIWIQKYSAGDREIHEMCVKGFPSSRGKHDKKKL